ncbi:UNVERIFIED_CONTAM: hypothetical protein FKN15_030701 [Acipenser sinensis]
MEGEKSLERKQQQHPSCRPVTEEVIDWLLDWEKQGGPRVTSAQQMQAVLKRCPAPLLARLLSSLAPKGEEPEHPTPEWEEPECPTPEWGEPEHPQPKRGESVHPQPKREESVRPQPKREESVCPQPKEGEVGASTALGPKLPVEG